MGSDSGFLHVLYVMFYRSFHIFSYCFCHHPVLRKSQNPGHHIGKSSSLREDPVVLFHLWVKFFFVTIAHSHFIHACYGIIFSVFQFCAISILATASMNAIKCLSYRFSFLPMNKDNNMRSASYSYFLALSCIVSN